MCVRCGTGTVAWCTHPTRHAEDELASAARTALATAADQITAIILAARQAGGIPPTIISLPEAIAYLCTDLDLSDHGPAGPFYAAQEKLARALGEFHGDDRDDDVTFDLLAAEVGARLAARSAFTDREISELRGLLLDDDEDRLPITAARALAAQRFMDLTSPLSRP